MHTSDLLQRTARKSRQEQIRSYLFPDVCISDVVKVGLKRIDVTVFNNLFKVQVQHLIIFQVIRDVLSNQHYTAASNLPPLKLAIPRTKEKTLLFRLLQLLLNGLN